jgi:hypothetical protein
MSYSDDFLILCKFYHGTCKHVHQKGFIFSFAREHVHPDLFQKFLFTKTPIRKNKS